MHLWSWIHQFLFLQLSLSVPEPENTRKLARLVATVGSKIAASSWSDHAPLAFQFQKTGSLQCPIAKGWNHKFKPCCPGRPFLDYSTIILMKLWIQSIVSKVTVHRDHDETNQHCKSQTGPTYGCKYCLQLLCACSLSMLQSFWPSWHMLLRVAQCSCSGHSQTSFLQAYRGRFRASVKQIM